MPDFQYPFGIEEEYFLSSAKTARLAGRVPRKLLSAARSRLGDSVTAELLQSQIEISSPIFHGVEQAALAMTSMRRELAELVATMDLQLLAASTHPLGVWREQSATRKPRYDRLMADFRILGQRLLVCGMHVHVAVPDGIDRIALMNRLMPWLPLFLALSSSSPFWNCHVTGLLSYRQAVYDEWPRTGIPDFFADEADYQHYVAVMSKTHAIEDASYIWWAIRPAMKFPTLELRIADICTDVQDGVALAALFRALVATYVEAPQLGAQRTSATRRLIDENRWRAKRDGIAARFIEESSQTEATVAQWLQRLLMLVADQAQRLGCTRSLSRLEDIVKHGTSAHMQLRIYEQRRAQGQTRAAALRGVVDWLVAATRGDVGRA